MNKFTLTLIRNEQSILLRKTIQIVVNIILNKVLYKKGKTLYNILVLTTSIDTRNLFLTKTIITAFYYPRLQFCFLQYLFSSIWATVDCNNLWLNLNTISSIIGMAITTKKTIIASVPGVSHFLVLYRKFRINLHIYWTHK